MCRLGLPVSEAEFLEKVPRAYKWRVRGARTAGWNDFTS